MACFFLQAESLSLGLWRWGWANDKSAHWKGGGVSSLSSTWPASPRVMPPLHKPGEGLLGPSVFSSPCLRYSLPSTSGDWAKGGSPHMSTRLRAWDSLSNREQDAEMPCSLWELEEREPCRLQQSGTESPPSKLEWEAERDQSWFKCHRLTGLSPFSRFVWIDVSAVLLTIRTFSQRFRGFFFNFSSSTEETA